MPHKFWVSMFHFCIWSTKENYTLYNKPVLDSRNIEILIPKAVWTTSQGFPKVLEKCKKKSYTTLLISSDKWSMIWSEWWLSSYQSTRHDAWRGYDETAKKLRLMALKATPNTDKQMIAIFLEQQQLLVGSITETF